MSCYRVCLPVPSGVIPSKPPAPALARKLPKCELGSGWQKERARAIQPEACAQAIELGRAVCARPVARPVELERSAQRYSWGAAQASERGGEAARCVRSCWHVLPGDRFAASIPHHALRSALLAGVPVPTARLVPRLPQSVPVPVGVLPLVVQ